MIHKLEHVIVVVLEAGQTGEHLHGFGGVTCVCVDSDGIGARKAVCALPTSHTYSHITRTLTEEECAREVRKIEDGYLKYGSVKSDLEIIANMGNPWFSDCRYYKEATKSLASLLSSLSIPTDKAVFVHIDNRKK